MLHNQSANKQDLSRVPLVHNSVVAEPNRFWFIRLFAPVLALGSSCTGNRYSTGTKLFLNSFLARKPFSRTIIAEPVRFFSPAPATATIKSKFSNCTYCGAGPFLKGSGYGYFFTAPAPAPIKSRL